MTAVSEAPLARDARPGRVANDAAGNQADRPGNDRPGNGAQGGVAGAFLRSGSGRRQGNGGGNNCKRDWRFHGPPSPRCFIGRNLPLPDQRMIISIRVRNKADGRQAAASPGRER